MIYHSKNADSYDVCTLDDLAAEARHACLDLTAHLGEFDAIAVTGLSGILPAVPVSLKLKVPLAILRKPYDNTHQHGGPMFSRDKSRWVGGEALTGCHVLWIDDFSASGDTRARIREAVAELGGRIVAEYMTRYRTFRPWAEDGPEGDSPTFRVGMTW